MTPKRLLVFRTGHLGDTLVALPAFWAIRRAFPDSRLTLLSNSDRKNPHYLSAANVLPANGLFDDWISYPNLSGGIGDAASLFRLAIKLRRERFDAVIYLMTRNRTASQIHRDVRFFRLAGIGEVIGSEFVKDRSLGLEIPRPTPRIERESDFLLNLLRSENIPADDSANRGLMLTPAERSRSDEWIRSAGVPSEVDYLRVAVSPGSKWDSKIWDEGRFGEVVERLIERHDVLPMVFGGAEDREKGERLRVRWGRGANAAGVLNVREAAAALATCKLYLGNDTGTMHLAAAVGTPCVAVFAAIDWVGRWEPAGEGHRTFRRAVECEGCHSPLCFNDHKCLDLVSVDEVYAACDAVLSKSSVVTGARQTT